MTSAKTDVEAAPSSGTDTDTTTPGVTTKEALPQPDDEDDEFPDGGLRAWLVVAGGAAVFFCCLGLGNSFGTFAAYYLSHQLRGHSPDAVAWIGSVSAFLPFVTGVLGGPLFDRYGAAVVRPGAALYFAAVMGLSACRTYAQLMLVQGVLMGAAVALLQFPAFAAVAHHFKRRRAAALGLMVAGSSLGGVVMPVLLSRMLNDSNLGFGWSVRVVGLIILPFLLFACFAIAPRLPPRPRQFVMFEMYRDAKFVLFCTSFLFILVGMFTPIFYLPTYAQRRGMRPALAGYLPAVLNGASTLGRVIPGVLADRYGPVNVFGIGAVATGVVVFCFNLPQSNASIIAYAAVFGFVSGTIISGASAAISVFARDARDIGTYMGMGMALASIGVLVGPPVNGAFVKAYGGYFEVSVFSGTVCLFGGILALAIKAMMPQGLFGRT
ncbi:Major facilitator superfamily domain, general substrate transporter [Cordyceps fumosorosea ARSEF 2679]|uniref:Major facilitator superfamily domain, general substrate transporter n=1 Tax=Cordyceps fumosorosea (strain ARSEF 2679) TaxID=1081104 RepID=A0A168ECA6_CORFA|nr:Major facilitator superfamily domain, general substrate transporter [Cordyceps fumosorosea ARSEF 2679]OAA73640.1 Major facilitator superfamily domain, general substrate transporter [Cordyceps fumosorosea ARSEF 2679]